MNVVFEDAGEYGEGAVRVARRRRDMGQDGIEEGLHPDPRRFGLVRRPALPGRGVEGRKIELFLIRAEHGEQIEHRIDDRVRPAVAAVHLVDHHDRREPALERLGEDELGLRHRAFDGIDQKQGAIHHRQDAFHLAAEIGMAGCRRC